MTASLVISNVVAYSLQIGLLVAIAAASSALLRIRLPHAKLAWWQLVLLVCLTLPAVEGWKRQIADGSVRVTATILAAAPAPAANPWPLPASEIPLALLIAGALARFGWLLLGFRRLGRYRRNSRRLEPASSWAVEADLRLSDEIRSPVTFGWRHPVVLLPAGFPELGEATREAVLCHEVLHVRRRDWLFTIGEELVRAALWFHPAIWWILGEIHLAREQAVDREAIGLTRARDQYVDALLAIAGTPLQLDFAPAPLFLRRRHLKQRVVSILKEVRMSKRKTVFAFAASGILLAGSCWFVTGAFPLEAAPQTINDGAGVAVDTGGSELLHRAPVVYPAAALAGKVEGTVVAQVKIDGSGNVADASIVSGPDELRKSVLESVLGWHFTKDAAGATRQISVDFRLPKDAPRAVAVAGVRSAASAPAGMSRTVGSISVGGMPPAARDELMAQLPVHVGDTMSPEAARRLLDTVRKYDEHLGMQMVPVSPTEMALTIFPQAPPPPPPPPPPASAAATKIRVGGNVQQANLVSKVTPAYPPDAKAARIQGIVSFDATIGKDGTVQSLDVVSGPPMLVPSAMEAVRQWVYRPTLLNGNPVDVITRIDVNYTLLP